MKTITFLFAIITSLISIYFISCQKGLSINSNILSDTSLNINDTVSNYIDSSTNNNDSIIIYKVYMSAKGNDVNTGLELNKAVKTLGRVQAILKQANPQKDIEVLINNDGIYYQDEIVWTYINGKQICFRAMNFSDINRPIFYGKGNENWFTLKFSGGRNTNLKFRHLRIEHYNCAIYYWGDQNNPASGWNGGNNISDCYFTNIGNKYSGLDEMAYGAVRCVNSRNNRIDNSHFVYLENKRDDELSHLHGVYLAHFSSNNIVYSSRFEKICGDPVRTRDRSNYNTFEENTFERTGKYGFFSDYYCSSETTDCSSCECYKISRSECPSFGNYFHNNDCNKGYTGNKINLFYLVGIDNYCGTLPTPRLRTLGNVNH